MIFVQKYYTKGDRIFILPLLHLAIILRAIAALMILGISSLIDVFKK
jgi:hypothetical protein